MENKWAAELKREKKNSSAKSQTNFALKKKQIKEELKYFKGRLQQFMKEKDNKKIENTLRILIGLRVDLFKIQMLESKKEMKAAEVKTMTDKIIEECLSLVGSCYQQKK